MAVTQIFWHNQPDNIASGGRHTTNPQIYIADATGSVVAVPSGFTEHVSLQLVAVSGSGTPFTHGEKRPTNGIATWYDSSHLETAGLGVVSMTGGTFKWRATRWLTDNNNSNAVVSGSSLGPVDTNPFTVSADTHPLYGANVTIADITGPVSTVSQITASGYTAYQTAYDTNLDYWWNLESNDPVTYSPSVGAGGYYDAALVCYAGAAAIEAENPSRAAVLWARGDWYAEQYRDLDILPNSGVIQAFNVFYEGLLIHYKRTGHYADVLALTFIGYGMWSQWARASVRDNTLYDDNTIRPPQRAYHAFIWCAKMGFPDGGSTWAPGTDIGPYCPPFANLRDWFRGKWLTWCSDHGATAGHYPQTGYCSNQANFQVSMLLKSFILDEHWNGNTTSIVAVVQAAVAYLATQYVTLGGSLSFRYLDGTGVDPCPGVGDSTSNHTDIDGLFPAPIAWAAWKTGRSDFRTLAQTIPMNMLTGNAYEFGGGHKQFNQSYATSRQSFGYLALMTPTDHLTVQIQPSNSTVSGFLHSQQPVINLMDVNNALLTSGSDVVTATLVTVSGTGSAIGTLTKNASSGVAYFTDLGVICVTGGRFKWRFSNGSVTVDSTIFAVQPPKYPIVPSTIICV